MSARAVSVPLQQLPNALTVARLVLIPVFVVLMLAADGGHSWPAGIVFGVAGVTDQVDGLLARRWQVESDFGRIADPLADRLMIDAALGYKAIAPQGYEVRVNLIGKAATWLLYAGIGILIVTHRSTHWPYWIFWAGLVLAVVAGVVYAAGARKDVRR
ncbi:MAG: CDP-alcohol phosphatidyltransferase family protein [Actinobacteria bacterium]|nr:MAG: CDP-alcohol phosphatidyltransferase family protein [Actinomycetota bacterium]